MRRFWKLLPLLAVLLSGCMMKTVDEMYCLPKRSEEYNNLQTAIDQVMSGLEYSAPVQGENQQTVQLADLTGDGQMEALLFAKGSGERPLKIFVFAKEGGVYGAMATIETAGTTFEQVEYAELDGAPGLELVVGRQVGNEVLHSLSAYSFSGGQADTILTAGYTRFLTWDLEQGPQRELVVLRPGGDSANGVVELYEYHNGAMERAAEAGMSVPVESLKRLTCGGMYQDTQAVFVASAYDDDTIVTDIYAVVNGRFTNVSLSNDSGTSVKTMRSYYALGDDIDNDGLIEIPDQLGREGAQEQERPSSVDLLRWYNITPDGSEVDKVYTCHNYVERWYVRLESRWMDGITVTRGNPVGQTQGYVFSTGADGRPLFTIYAFTGDDREALATGDGRFLLNRTDEVVYAAALGSSRQAPDEGTLISHFNFILEDWKTGET